MVAWRRANHQKIGMMHLKAGSVCLNDAKRLEGLFANKFFEGFWTYGMGLTSFGCADQGT